MAWQGPARPGTARRGTAWLGLARQGLPSRLSLGNRIQPGAKALIEAGLGRAGQGVDWSGMVW